MPGSSRRTPVPKAALKRSIFGVALVSLLPGLLAADEPRAAQKAYDFFANARYPGQRRPHVGLDKLEQEGGEDAASGYGRRVVHWWPKKGVDIVDPPEGVELRTWTIRTPEVEPLIEASAFRKWWPATLRDKKQFKAHLLGFRGIGSKEGNPFAAPVDDRVRGKGMCPAVVLRLEDGRKRCFTRGSFIDADQDYILALYEKEMARLRTTQAPPPIRKHPRTVGELYKPGTYDVYSDFFHFYSGSQGPPGGFSPWVNEEHKDLAERYRKATVRHFEDYWAYVEYAGQRQHYWNEPRDKWPLYFVKVCGTMKDGYSVIPGFAGGGRGACEIKDASWPAFYHEWGHGSSSSTSLGGGEAKTDSHQPMADPTLIGKVEHQIQRPHMNLFHGWYPAGLAWTMMGDDPNWGYAAVASLNSMGNMVATPMHKMAKLGEERGIWQDGIRGVGGFFGEMGARFAEYDWELEAEVRGTFPAPNRAYLVALDRKAGLYRSDPIEAPEMFGVNLVRLTAEPGAKQIAADFRGFFDPDTYSDWRACLVAVDKDSRCRYSPLWNKGKMSIDTRPCDKRYWLTVTATPYALSDPQKDGKWYGSPYAYKYPYDVQLSGCRPANPHAPVGVNENLDLIGPVFAKNAITGGQRGAEMDWPHPSDAPEYADMKAHLERLLEKAPAAIKAHLAPGLYGGRPPERALALTALLIPRVKYLLENAQGARHPNGGGWVARSATVAPTAYVGPDCMVLDGAKVLDRAIIEDYAIVSGDEVVVKDHAKVYGKAIVCGAAELSGYARVSRNILNRTCAIDFNPADAKVPCSAEVMASGMARSSGPELRRFVFDGSTLGLQANYEFDQPETTLMEDYYQEHGNDDTYLQELVFYNGVLYGRPGFVKDGDIRAATFNGKDQYAEAAANVADLGEITVDLSLKWAGGGNQTLFDFGTSEDNCFKLVLTSSGEPVLHVCVKGKSEDAKSRTAIKKGQWANCRVEIDGKAIRLWVNSEKVAEAKSSFRAADVYPAGVEQRNFVAAARGARNPYCGAIDYVRIFHVVHEDFGSAPEVPLVSSRRINPDYPQRFRTKYADYALKEAKAAGELEKDELYAFYKRFYADINKRRAELQQSDEADRLEKELEALKSERDRRRNELTAEFNSRSEIKEKRARYDELKQLLEVRSAEARKEYAAALAESDRKSKAAQSLVKEIEDAARTKRTAEFAAMQKELDALKQTHGAYLDGLIEKDPEGKEVQEKLRAAREELKTLDDKKDRDRRGRVAETISGLERHIRDIRRRLDSDPKAQDMSRRLEKTQYAQKLTVESQAKLDPRYHEAVQSLKRWGTFDRQRAEIESAIADTPDIAAIKTEMEAISENDRAFVGKGMWDFINKCLQDQDNRIKALEARINKARQDAVIAKNWDEFNCLPMGWTANQQFGVIRKRFMARELPVITEYEKRFDAAFASQQAKWHTEVDWDDRLDWENEPFERLSPTVQTWLKRTKPYVYK